MKVLMIVPAYNEELNICNTVNKLKKLRSKNHQIDYIVINDGSTDGTLKVCQEHHISVIPLIQNLGIGGAVQTGYKYAYENDYDVAIQFDGDGQHDERYIEALLEQIEAGYDFVIGSRFVKELSQFKSTATRRLGIRILSFLIQQRAHIKIYDPTSGFRAGNRKVISLFVKNYPMEYPEPESIIYLNNHHCKIKEIPVKMHERSFGTSSINFMKSVYYMFSVSIAIIAESLFNPKRKEEEKVEGVCHL